MEMEQQVCVDILRSEEGSFTTSVVCVVDEEESLEEKVGKIKASCSISAKKPPRPHRGFSLDAADHRKLIKELAAMKRARIERMKALMQKKATSKASSSSSAASLFAMIFTIVVFIVILFQGMSCQISCGTISSSNEQQQQHGLMFIHEELINPSALDSV